MKTKLWSILLLFSVITGFSQTIGDVGINTSTPHRSAVLDLTSDNKGLLVPRLTTAAINDLSMIASEGLIVFDKDKKLFLGWNGGQWITFGLPLTGVLADQSFASWEVSGLVNYGPQVLPAAATLASVISSASLERGIGLSITGGPAALSDAWGAQGWPADISDALAQDKFITLRLAFHPSKTISLSRIAAHLLRRSGTGPDETLYQFSTDGGINFTDIGSAINLPIETAPGNFISEISLRPFATLQAIKTSDVPTLIIRIINYGATNATTGRWYLADLSGPDFELIGDILP